MSNPKSELLANIKSKAVVHGKVILASGREANYYVDLRRVTLDSEAAPLVGEVMLDATAHLSYEAVGGLTLGADPVATAMLHAAAKRGKRLDAFVVRKAEKAHGLQRRIEGGSFVMLAKGNRSAAVTQACKQYGGFYLGSIGGPAARLAQDCIKSVEVLEYPELGMEAIWKIEVEEFPAFIVVDDKGNDFFAETSKPLTIGARPEV